MNTELHILAGVALSELSRGLGRVSVVIPAFERSDLSAPPQQLLRPSSLSAARNRGIRESWSEFIAFLDADDLWRVSKIEKQVEYFSAHPNVGLAHTDANRLIDATGIVEPDSENFDAAARN